MIALKIKSGFEPSTASSNYLAHIQISAKNIAWNIMFIRVTTTTQGLTLSLTYFIEAACFIM